MIESLRSDAVALRCRPLGQTSATSIASSPVPKVNKQDGPVGVPKTDVVATSRASDTPDDSAKRFVVSPVAYEGENPKSFDHSGAVFTEEQAGEIPAPPGASPPRVLGFREAIDAALMRNPDVVTARAAGPVADATRVVTATYPWNPSVQVQVDPFDRAEDGTSLQTRNQVIVTQTIELAHQSRYRREAAAAGWQAQHATIAQSEWNVATTAMRAYFELMYRKGLLDVAVRSADLQTQTTDIVNRRYKAGLSTATEQLTAQVTARQFQKQAALAQADYVTALNALRNVLNLPPEDVFEVDSRVDSYRWLPLSDVCSCTAGGGSNSIRPLREVLEDSIANRPDVATARYNAATAQSNLDLAKANTVPNVATGPTYERDESGTLFFGVSAQMDLPVWNTGCPLVRQRAAELQQELITLSQARVRAELQVQAAANRYAVASKLWNERRDVKRPGSSESTTAINAFEQGQATILEVLSIQEALVQEQKSDLDLFHEVSQAAIDVVASLALDPGQLIQLDGSMPGCVIRQPGS